MIKKVKMPDGTIKKIKVPDGMPNEQIYSIVQKMAGGVQQQSQGVPASSPQMVGPQYKETYLSQEHPVRRKIADAARTITEGVAPAVSGFMGTAAGGPGTGVAAGALAYAMTKNINDRVHEALDLAPPEKKKLTLKESTNQAIKDLSFGASAEMLGFLPIAASSFITRAYRKIKSVFDISDQAAFKQAEKMFSDLANSDPDALTNYKRTEEVLQNLDVKTSPTIAQRTGSTQAALKEQSLMAKDPEFAAEVINRRDLIRGEAQAGLGRKFSGGTIDDATAAVSKSHGAKSEAVDAARREYDDLVGRLGGKQAQDVGDDIYNVSDAARKAEKKVVDKLYDKIPKDTKVDVGPIENAIREIQKDVDVFPKSEIKELEGLIEKTQSVSQKVKSPLLPGSSESDQKQILFNELKQWRTKLSNKIRGIYEGTSEDKYIKARQYEKLNDAAKESMEQLSGTKDSATKKAYDEATQAFIKYKEKYRVGSVEEIMRPGKSGNGRKIGASNVPAKFNNPDQADNLINAVGKDNASGMMDQYYAFEYASRAQGSEQSLSSWVMKNGPALKKYGLYDKYANLAKKKGAIDVAADELKNYEKAVAKKYLGADPGKQMDAMFGSGPKAGSDVGLKMKELLNADGIRGNAPAINGIKTEFKDYLLRLAESNSAVSMRDKNPTHHVATLKKVLDSRRGALNVLYKDEPEKIKALYDYLDLSEILERNTFVSGSKGSTTAEKFESYADVATRGGQFIAVSAGRLWVVNTGIKLVRSALNLPANLRAEAMDRFYTRLAVDPDAAKLVMDGERIMKKFGEKAYKRMIRTQAIAMGVISGKNYRGDEEKKANEF